MQRSKVLILGSSGYLGAALAIKLSDEMDVVGTSRNIFTYDHRIEVNTLIGDFYEANLIELCLDVDFVIHLGSQFHPRAVITDQDLEMLYQNEIKLLVSLVKLAELGHLKKVLFISSAGEIYGEFNGEVSFEGQHPQPLSAYGRLKLNLENDYIKSLVSHAKVGIFRLANPYGKPRKIDETKNFLNKSIYHAIQKNSVEVWGPLESSRDFIYIDDFTNAVYQFLTFSGDLPLIMNIGSGTSTTLLEVITKIKDIFPNLQIIHTNKDFIPSILTNKINIDLAKKALGWGPSIGIEVGLRKTRAYVKNNIVNH
jgi:nucleoside-diphosphate-sugar epimerase